MSGAVANPLDAALALTAPQTALDRALAVGRRPRAGEQVQRAVDFWGLERQARAAWPVMPDGAADRLDFCGPLTLPEPVHPVDAELLIINPGLAAAGPFAMADQDQFGGWCAAVNRRRRALASAWLAGGIWFQDDPWATDVAVNLCTRFTSLARSSWSEASPKLQIERQIDRQIDALEAMLLSLQAYEECLGHEA